MADEHINRDPESATLLVGLWGGEREEDVGVDSNVEVQLGMSPMLRPGGQGHSTMWSCELVHTDLTCLITYTIYRKLLEVGTMGC